MAKQKTHAYWAEQYAKRKARGIARGLSVQQARGHKPREHVERAQKEAAKSGLSSQQRTAVRHFYNRFNPQGYGGVPTLGDMEKAAEKNGYAWFKNYRGLWDFERAQKRARAGRSEYRQVTREYVEDWVEDYELPDETWMYGY